MEKEKKLVRQILKKEEKAIRRFYEKYSSSLFAFIAGKIEKKEDAEEILQDTFLSIFDSLPLFNFKSSLLTWAKKIALHEVTDFYRKRKIKAVVFSRLPFLENIVSEALGPEMDYQKEEIKQDIKEVMLTLSEGYRQILRLKYIEGLTMKEAAKALHISFKSVESKLFRARLAFQKLWKEKYLGNQPVLSSFLASKRRI